MYTQLPHTLYNQQAIKTLEQLAVSQLNITEYTLMQRAASAAFSCLRANWPTARRVIVLAGGGNNGGDGFEVARLMHMAGFTVQVLHLGDLSKTKGAALEALAACQAAKVSLAPWTPTAELVADVLIDALLGTGLNETVRGDYARAIMAINQSRLPVLALDLPSGIQADTGAVMGYAVHATVTVTFIGLKQGLFTHCALDYSGRVFCDALSLPDELMQQVPATATRLQLSDSQRLLRPRAPSAHKGNFGHVLVIGGDFGMAGAVRMAAEAAARVGAGLVSVATLPEHIGVVMAGRPELMCHGVMARLDLTPLLDKATALVIGPGLGQSRWSVDLLNAALGRNLPTVIDADGLNLLAQQPQHKARWILTPHPGEAARLLQRTVAEVQADRFTSARDMVARFGGVCVLKGAGTLVAHHDQCTVNTTGNPGMASGGMGDILSGIIGGLLAQGLDLMQAAQVGVCLHGAAADLAAKSGQRGLLATDLLPHLRQLVNYK